METHQVKSRWYYIFWGAMAVAVVGGQLYVGSGYREMAKEQRAFAQAVYDTQMGWDARTKAAETVTPHKLNRTGEYD